MQAKFPNLLPRLNVNSWRSEQGILSLVTFTFGAFLLFVSIALGLFLSLWVFIFDEFLEPPNLNVDTFIVLGLTFVIGWIITLLSIRVFMNQLMPKIIRFYCWLCGGYAALVYLKLTYNLYVTGYTKERYYYYLFAVLVGILATIIMQLLLERYDLKWFGIPILVASFLHLMVMLIHYVINPGGVDFSSLNVSHILHHISKVVEAYPEKAASFVPSVSESFYFQADITFFVIMLIVGIYLILDAPVFFRPTKRLIDSIFASPDL